MRVVEVAELPRLPVIGQGTWGMGERRERRTAEIDALKLGISLGMTLINTAEIYGAGGAEEVVGEAVRGSREDVFIVTKVWPSNGRPRDLEAAVHRSLQRMGTEYADLVLLHWPTRGVPLAEILRGLRALQASGLARHVGVSNFDVAWLEAVRALEEHPGELCANEVPFSLTRRGIEHGVLQEAARAQRLILAYSPLAHGRFAGWEGKTGLVAAAQTHGVTPLQVALAWTVQATGVAAIPKAVSPAHVRANAAAGDIVLKEDEMAAIDRDFPASERAFRPDLPQNGAFLRLVYGALNMQRRFKRA